VAEYVVCTKCGTRIKAGREFCLRCFEPLPNPDEPVRVPVWESLGLSQNTEIMVVAGTALAAVGLVLLIWQTPAPMATDDVARPANPVPVQTLPAPSAPAEVAPGAAVAAGTPVIDSGLETARDGYEDKLAGRPNDPELHTQLGQVLRRMGRTDEAVQHFERAVALDPRKPSYRANLAQASSDLGQWDRAIDQYREATRLLPGDYGAQYALAMALQKKGDDQTAIPEFQKALKFNPAESGAVLGLATSLEKTGHVDDARQEYQKYVEMRPIPADVDRVKAHLAQLPRTRPQVK
jgi:tetratricopeptide (TPR) repeat protein